MRVLNYNVTYTLCLDEEPIGGRYYVDDNGSKFILRGVRRNPRIILGGENQWQVEASPVGSSVPPAGNLTLVLTESDYNNARVKWYEKLKDNLWLDYVGLKDDKIIVAVNDKSQIEKAVEVVNSIMPSMVDIDNRIQVEVL